MEYDPSKGWEYTLHPCVDSVRLQCDEIIQCLSSSFDECESLLADTRSNHKLMFCFVTPTNSDYFAGNYRGADFEHLKNYNVTIGEFIGAAPAEVETIMEEFSKDVPLLLEKYEFIASKNTSSPAVRLLNYCQLISILFVKFLAIHPYANGNGHVGRLIVWTLLQKKKDCGKIFGPYLIAQPSRLIAVYMLLEKIIHSHCLSISSPK
ncbi:MAG: Fic family protein [Pusillimonas sp.]